MTTAGTNLKTLSDVLLSSRLNAVATKARVKRYRRGEVIKL